MKKRNLFITLLMASALIVSCGSDNKGGGGDDKSSSSSGQESSNTSVNENATGTATEMKTADQLINNISAGNFAVASTSGHYAFTKKSGSPTQRCNVPFFDDKFNTHEYIGYRVLNSNGEISRTLDVRYCDDVYTFTFEEDEKFGANLSELASKIADYVRNARDSHSVYNPTLQKVVNGYAINYVKPDETCNQFDYNCENSKNADTKVWNVKIDGAWYQINLGQALIQNPKKFL